MGPVLCPLITKLKTPTSVLAIAIATVLSIAACTTKSKSRDEKASGPEGMVWLAGGEFTMGTSDEESYEHERPAHRVHVDGFWIDQTEVTNKQFLEFVEATGYVTIAEQKPEWVKLQQQLPPGTTRPNEDKL